MPTLAGQSPGRGDCVRGGDGGDGGGVGAVGGAADDEPQLESEIPIPIAAIVLNIAELPTALPTALRNSRRLMSLRSDVTRSPVSLLALIFPENIFENSFLHLSSCFNRRH
jgi:hypothetical protein